MLINIYKQNIVYYDEILKWLESFAGEIFLNKLGDKGTEVPKCCLPHTRNIFCVWFFEKRETTPVHWRRIFPHLTTKYRQDPRKFYSKACFKFRKQHSKKKPKNYCLLFFVLSFQKKTVTKFEFPLILNFIFGYGHNFLR